MILPLLAMVSAPPFVQSRRGTGVVRGPAGADRGREQAPCQGGALEPAAGAREPWGGWEARNAGASGPLRVLGARRGALPFWQDGPVR